jgi:hypothetical protein
MFVGAMTPNWLLCRREIGQGAKLAYARLAQHAGKNGKCFPKQQTLAAELGVSERMANEYIRILVKFGLIEKERPGLGMSNRYFFLDHPWIKEGPAEARRGSDQKRKESSASDQQNSAGQDRPKASSSIIEEIHQEMNQGIRVHPHSPPKGDYREDTACVLTQEEEIYSVYPKKVGKPVALRAIRRALAKQPFSYLLERTKLYAQTCTSPAEFIPHPSTWFNQERFNDDPTTWRRTVGQDGNRHPEIIRPSDFACGVSKL